MNKTEAERIAAAVNILRPEWSTGLLMKVLGDERMIRRPYADALTALVVCSLDSDTQKPGRVHEKGAWWSVVTAVSGQQGPSYRSIDRETCIICGHGGGWALHSGDHEFENPLLQRKGATPTPEQRAALDAAAAEAKAKATAAKEEVAAREVAPVDEVLARHTTTPATTTARDSSEDDNKIGDVA